MTNQYLSTTSMSPHENYPMLEVMAQSDGLRTNDDVNGKGGLGPGAARLLVRIVYLQQADRAYGMEISPRSFVISYVILLYAISYNICI